MLLSTFLVEAIMLFTYALTIYLFSKLEFSHGLKYYAYEIILFVIIFISSDFVAFLWENLVKNGIIL